MNGDQVLVAPMELATAVSASLPDSRESNAFLISTNRYIEVMLPAEEKRRTIGA